MRIAKPRYNLFYRTSTYGRHGRRTAPRVAKERYDGEVSTCVNGLVDTSGGGSSRVSLAELDEYSRGVSDSTR